MRELGGRRAYFDDYAERIGDMPPSLRSYGLRFTCPCCGYPTLQKRGLDGICFLCSWEDDGQDDDDADDVRHGPNAGFSLRRARENFVTYGVMYEPETDRRVGGRDTAEENAIKGRVVGAFEEMREVAVAEHERLWAIVFACERELYRLLVEAISPRRGN